MTQQKQEVQRKQLKLKFNYDKLMALTDPNLPSTVRAAVEDSKITLAEGRRGRKTP